MRKIFIVAIFLLAFSVIGKGQGTTEYRFLEVIDSANKPVIDATVKVQIHCDGGDKKTNEKGKVERFPIGGGDCGQLYDFSISKDGYFPFRDIGLFSAPFNDLYREQFIYDKYYGGRNYKIELLKIPQNKAEQKAIGSEEQKRELFWAVRDKDTAKVRELLKAGISPNLTTTDLRGVWLAPDNLPAIVYAAALGDIETIREFVKAGTNLRRKDSLTRNILLIYLGSHFEEAQLNQYLDGVDFLINSGADINATTKDRKTALMIAAKNGDLRTVRTLLSKNVSVDQPDSTGLTALIYATTNLSPQNLEIVEMLLKKGADINLLVSDSKGGCSTALINAAATRNLPLVKFLLNNKANINLACPNGINAFRAAIPSGGYPFSNDRNEILETLLAAGADVNAADSSGQTNLMFAASRENWTAVGLLLKKGALINDRDKNGNTALMYIPYWGENYLLKFLLENGADPNAVRVIKYGNGVADDCETPLMRAAISDKSEESIQLLVNYGAKVDFACQNGETALTRAARDPELGSVRKLLELGADAKSEQGHRALQYAKEMLRDRPWSKDECEQIIKLLETAGAK